MRFELHCHSTCSDGTESPEQVAKRAAERNIEVFALTDHDTCAGTAHVAGARNLRAVELTCDSAGRTIHVLVYDRGGAWSAIEDQLAAIRESRKNRLRGMAAQLQHRGSRIDVEPFPPQAGQRAGGRPDPPRPTG